MARASIVLESVVVRERFALTWPKTKGEMIRSTSPSGTDTRELLPCTVSKNTHEQFIFLSEQLRQLTSWPRGFVFFCADWFFCWFYCWILCSDSKSKSFLAWNTIAPFTRHSNFQTPGRQTTIGDGGRPSAQEELRVIVILSKNKNVLGCRGPSSKVWNNVGNPTT